MNEPQRASPRTLRWRWPKALSALREDFAAAEPFPHAVLDGVFDNEALQNAFAAVPAHDSQHWTVWGNGAEHEACVPLHRKRGISSLMLLDPAIGQILQELNSDAFVADLSELSGIPNLVVDHTFTGGGLHCTGRGANLRLHVDRVRHPRPRQFDQALNLLLYINPNWRAEYGGDLELLQGDSDGQHKAGISPLFNRLVLFRSNRQSYHGHPTPVSAPEHEFRTSLAAYYYVAREEIITGDWDNSIGWR